MAGNVPMPIRARSDGARVAPLHPMRRIMPFLMPGRNEAFVLFEQLIDTAPAMRHLASVNAGRPPERAITLFHLVLRALGLTLAEFPRLNRFVAGSHLYDRRGIWLTFSAKKRLERDAPMFTGKILFDAREPLAAFVDRVLDTVAEGRSGRATGPEREASFFLKLPASVLRIGTRILRWLDHQNLVPDSFIAGDPLYASVFIANLGSVGLDAAFHHLFEYGTIPIFVTIGRRHQAPVVLADGSVGAREVVALRYTYDERIEDGFYAARALEYLKACLESPERLG
jgi:hypothetical protein